jgi:ABC-type transporter Mla MlaB component
MLKITIRADAKGMTFVLEGKLAGPWVKELEVCQRSARAQERRPVRFDLSAVTFIDAEGKALLGRVCREGAELIASGCLNKCIVEEITRSSSIAWKEKEA